jgi:hypothetical protein
MKQNPLNLNHCDSATTVKSTRKSSYNRRNFVKSLLATGAAANFANLASAAPPPDKGKPNTPHGNPNSRRMQAYNIRVQAAADEAQQPIPDQTDNGDEDRYTNLLGSFSKGLPHNNLGEVDQKRLSDLLAGVGQW